MSTNVQLEKAKLTEARIKRLGANPKLNVNFKGKEPQTFRGKQGFWITRTDGRTVFITLNNLQGASLTRQAKKQKGIIERLANATNIEGTITIGGAIVIATIALRLLNRKASSLVSRAKG